MFSQSIKSFVLKRPASLFSVMLLAALSWSSCESSPFSSDDDSSSSAEEAIPVRVMSLALDSVDRELIYTANLVAFEQVHYAPSQPGRIERIHVNVGDRVHKGQVLVEMDRTQLSQALLQVENARSTYRRMDTLYSMNSISQQQYEQAKTQYEVAVANLEFLKENTTLSAPFSGVVTGRYFEPGEVYSGAPNTAEGKAAILTLMQISPLKAEVNISEKYFPQITTGMSARICTDIYPEQMFMGTIHKVHPVINPVSRNFTIEVKADNPGEKLRPGMFARVRINLRTASTMLVPSNVVLRQDGTNRRYIFVEENGKAKKIMVETGERYDDRLEIISDELETGMEVIVAGQTRLTGGEAIKVIR